MKQCIVFGGSGYIGTQLIRHFLERNTFEKILIGDIKESPITNNERVLYHKVDVRLPIDIKIEQDSVGWIFNLAAVHREPGHLSEEYFQTNVFGAKHVCDFAEKIKCNNLFFTASISVYGPTLKPTD
ncbi:MAG: NAD-dependent epimerase/dehydratase family protein, partial [Flammeovirgaceae bacterium]